MRSAHDYVFGRLDYGTMKRTRYHELGYSHDGPTLWRIYDLGTGRPVGPQYVSQRELLCDLDRFATVFGCS